jgi:hypothetical protein
VYAVGHTAIDIYAPVMAAVLLCGRGAVASGGSAAWIWGFGSPGGSTIEVLREGSRSGWFIA